MKKTLILSLSILGFSSLISQVIVIRELAMSFYANEFFIGWILFCWLLGTAFGSALGSKASGSAQSAFRSLVLCHVLAAFLFPAVILFIRYGKMILGTPAGSTPELLPSLAYSLAAMTPLCGVLGMQFVIAARGWRLLKPEGDAARAVGRAYLWECLGFIAGGILFSFVLIFAVEFRVAAVMAGFNLTCAWAVLRFVQEAKAVRWALAVVSVLFPAWLFLSGVPLQQQTAQWRFPSERLIRTENTVHGNVAVTRLGRQYNFYQSGLLLGADRADLASEYLVHFPLLAHPSPRKVLLLGTGFNGPLAEILKHDPQEVVSVELDPGLVAIAEEYLPKDLKAVLHDPRVKVRGQDPLDFLRADDGVYDVIIANFPDPSSVLINRNYTEQFFFAVRSRLAPDGVFATHLSFAANFMTPGSERRGRSVYATLKRVFPVIQVLPEDTLFLLASSRAAAPFDPKEMARRLSGRGLRTDFVTAEQIFYRFENDRVLRVQDDFARAGEGDVNTGLQPRTCYFEFLRWLVQFDPGLARSFSFLTQVPFPVLGGACLGMLLLAGFFAKNPGARTRRLALLSMGTAGFSLMAFEIVVIYLFQAAYGNLYYRLAWVITSFMAGLGIGTWAALTIRKAVERKALVVLHASNALFFFLLMHVCARVFLKGFSIGDGAQPVFLVLALLGGVTAGMAFPFANRFYLAEGGGKRLGSVYAADLLGAAFGALLTAGFLIPIWGVPRILLLLGAANALLVLLFLFRKNLGGKHL